MVIRVKDHPVLFGLEEAYMEVQEPVEGACQTLDVLEDAVAKLLAAPRIIGRTGRSTGAVRIVEAAPVLRHTVTGGTYHGRR